MIKSSLTPVLIVLGPLKSKSLASFAPWCENVFNRKGRPRKSAFSCVKSVPRMAEDEGGDKGGEKVQVFNYVPSDVPFFQYDKVAFESTSPFSTIRELGFGYANSLKLGREKGGFLACPPQFRTIRPE